MYQLLPLTFEEVCHHWAISAIMVGLLTTNEYLYYADYPNSHGIPSVCSIPLFKEKRCCEWDLFDIPRRPASTPSPVVTSTPKPTQSDYCYTYKIKVDEDVTCRHLPTATPGAECHLCRTCGVQDIDPKLNHPYPMYACPNSEDECKGVALWPIDLFSKECGPATLCPAGTRLENSTKGSQTFCFCVLASVPPCGIGYHHRIECATELSNCDCLPDDSLPIRLSDKYSKDSTEQKAVYYNYVHNPMCCSASGSYCQYAKGTYTQGAPLNYTSTPMSDMLPDLETIGIPPYKQEQLTSTIAEWVTMVILCSVIILLTWLIIYNGYHF
jgi:hypothetical protein